MEYKYPFRLEQNEYERDIDIIDAYVEQVSFYTYNNLNRIVPLDEIKNQVRLELAPGGEFATKYPDCKVFIRDQKTGDRKEKTLSIDRLFRTAIDKELITAPSLTFYVPEKIKKSKVAEFIEINVAKRAKIKKEMFEAMARKDDAMAAYKKNEQIAVKTINNGSSGAFSSPYTILYNQSSHSALTSTCRTATSFGNSGNERLFSGSRHYDSPSRVIDHLITIATLTNFNDFIDCCTEYNLHLPNVDETMNCITNSTKLYFKNDKALEYIRRFVGNLTAYERAAFCYMEDFYHLAKYNDALMRGMFTEYMSTPNSIEWDLNEVASNIDGDMQIIISQLRKDVVPVGKSFGDVKKNDPEGYNELLKTGYQIQFTTTKYYKLLKNILTTKNLPINIAKMPNVIRRVGVVSDTDSTMSTVQWWSKWFAGNYYDANAAKMADLMTYMSTQHLRHLMASMSTNIGVDADRRFLYAMKNEFKFDSFILTEKAKHYAALITAQEGQLKHENELEMKGVSLRSASIPLMVMNEFKDTVKELLETAAKGEKIHLLPVMNRIAVLEHDVVNSLNSGEYKYLKTTSIKDRSAYNEKDEKNYHYHRMYNTIFGPKYGYLEEPPYDAIKLPVNLSSKTAILRWIDNIDDPIIKNGAIKWFEETDYRKYKTLILPEYLVSNYGIPSDLIKAANPRKTAFATVEPFYHILESFGIFMIDDNRTRLLSDYYGTNIESNELDLEV